MATAIDWYDRRDELRPDQVFTDFEGDLLKLDRGVPGDGTDWYAAVWCNGHWSYEDCRIHPSDLRERVADPAAAA